MKGEKRCLKAGEARRIIGKEGNWIRQRREDRRLGMKRKMKKRRIYSS